MQRTRPRTLITGASSGIGEAFARRLAADGHDLVLVARREDRLAALAQDLGRTHGVHAEVLVADLTEAEDLDRVAKRLASSDAPVAMLVNNAGFGAYGAFDDLPLDRQLAMIDLNVRALVRLTHAAVDPMRTRGTGTIVNVASTAAFQPDPYGAVYGATKGFVLQLTHSLHEELRGSGVRVMALAPGLTRTEFQETAEVDPDGLPRGAVMSPDEVVRVALRDLGRGRVVSVPGAVNRVMAASSSVSPAWMSRKLSGVTHQRFFA